MEKLFRTEMAAALKNSSESFAGALNNISQSMVQISSSLNRSLEVLAQTLETPQATHPTPLLPAYHPRDNPLSYPAMNSETFNYQQS